MRAILLAVVFAAACGYKPETAAARPPITIESVLSGEWTGDRMLFDKNENLIQVALVEMKCAKQSVHTAVCDEAVTYQDPGRAAHPGLSGRTDHAGSRWEFHYQDQGPVALQMTTGDFRQKGEVRGSLIYLKGEGLIPRSNVSASRETRIFAADVSESRLVQVDVYSRHGVELGRAVTAWRRNRR